LALFKRQRKKAGKALTDPVDPGPATAPGADGVELNAAEPEPQALTAPIVVVAPAPEPAEEPSPQPAETAMEESTVQEPAVQEPVVPLAAEEPAPQPPAEEPAPQPAAEEPAPQPAAEEPAPQPAAEEPAPQPAAEEPAPQEPAPQPAPQEPAPALAEAPQGQDVAEVEEAASPPPNDTLPVALEPELRRIIDTAVARVASIELEAIRESRRLTQRSEEEGREALKFALDRAFQLVNSFELLTVTVAGMVSALRVELDTAMAALEHVDDPYSHRPPQLEKSAPAVEESAPAVEQTAPAAEEKQPQPTPHAEGTQGMNGESAELLTEPSPEMTEMFREQIINMKTSGKTRDEAERTLLRFNLGRRFIGLLDEIYSEEPTEGAAAPADPPRKRFARGFFSRH
jgi:hypothetical protein